MCVSGFLFLGFFVENFLTSKNAPMTPEQFANLTEEEKDAHAAFVQQLGENAVWNKLETKN